MPRSGSSSVKSGSSKSARNRRLKDKLNELKQKMDQVRSLWEKFDSLLSGFVEKIFSKTLQDRETEEFLQNYRHNLDPLLWAWFSPEGQLGSPLNPCLHFVMKTNVT